MKYQTMPPLSEDDAIALEKSIRTHGIQVPVLMDDEGAIIDGHHRWEIANRYSLPCPTRVAEGLDEGQKVALSISLNVDRRQLTRQQKREVIEASLKAQPEASNREHARRTGVDDKTVATVRGALESTAEIPQLDKTRGADGREGVVHIVTASGARKAKPRTMALSRISSGGAAYTQDVLIESFTREDLMLKRREILAMRESYNDTLRLIDGTLAFLDSAGTDDVATAEAILGMSLDSWLEDAA